ncbi:MAG: hypothetical protein JRJ60_08755, partial [Deltaproteobacteria bacterium]|nr:hypothetical protein [Deltaproteobacteria bacterium]
LFDPPIVKGRKLIESGLLGDLVYGEGRYFLDTPKMIEEKMDSPDHWVYSLNSGLASEYSPHTIYLLQSFLGPASEIQVIHENMNISPTVQPGLEAFAVQLRFQHAVGRTLMLAKMPYGHFGIDLYGTRAAVHINMMDLTYRVEMIRKGLPLVAARMESTVEQGITSLIQTVANAFRIGIGSLKRRPGHRTLIKEFYRSLRSHTPVPVPGEDGLDTVRTLEMIDREIGSAIGK